MIPFFQGFETNDTTGITVATGATISRVTSGTNSICGAINSLTGNEYAVLTPGNDAWGVCAGGALGDTAGGNNGDFINGPPYPPYVGDFTLSMSFYIPITGTGAWSAAPNQSFAAFQIWGNSNSETQQYDLELPEIYFGVPGGGSPVSIFYNTGGWAICSAPGWPIASISSNGWYTFATSYIKTGDRVNDPTAAVITVYNSAGNIVGVPFPIPGWQPNSAQIPYAGESVQNGVAPPSSDLLGSAQWGIESWQTPQDTGLMVGPSGGYSSTWQPAGICIDNIQTLVGQLNPANAPVFSNLTSGKMLNATIGTAFSLTLSASNATSYYIAGYNAGVHNSGGFDGLPAGLTLNSSTGAITGTPTGSASYQDLLVMAVNATSFTLLRVHLNVAASGTSAITTVPTITGTSQVGSTLTCNHGTYTNTPTSYAYQWFSNGVKISGATGSTYTCATSDIGNVITVSETPSNGTGAGQIAFSLQTTLVLAKIGVPVNTAIPVITGTVGTVGAILTTSTGNWTNSPTGYVYTWYLNGQPITATYSNGSTSSTYTQQAWDVIGLPVTVSVQAYNATGYSLPVYNVVAPPQALAAGYSDLVFYDDFVNPATVSVTGTGLETSGINWFNGMWYDAPNSSVDITFPTNSVIQLAQRTTDSPTNLTTVDRSGGCGGAKPYPNTFSGGAYFEARMNMNPSNNQAWDAFWALSLQHMLGTDNCGGSNPVCTGASGSTGEEWAELDFIEQWPPSAGASVNGYFAGTVHDWVFINNSWNSPSANYQNSNNFQNIGVDETQWHVYGTLWTPSTITWYVDNVAVMSAPTPAILNSQSLFMILSAQAIASQMTQTQYLQVDWVRVWQSGVVSPPPSNSVLPTVTGTAQVGQTLTGTQGTWTGATSFAYQWIWKDTSANISGATSLTYVPVLGDIGHTLSIIVTATNSAGSTSATSLATSVTTGATFMSKTINYQYASSSNAGLGAYTGDGVSSPTWNASTSSPITTVLNSDGTAATGVSIAFTSSDGSYGGGATPPIFQSFLMSNPHTQTCTISGLLASGSYTLYLYGQNAGWNDRGTLFSITGGSGSPASGSNTATVNIAGDSGVYLLNSNYVVFNVTANSSGVLQISYTANPVTPWDSSYTPPNAIGNFNGFQLVSVSGSLPSNSVIPTISGPVAVGNTLTATQGTWSGATSYSYQWVWFDTGANIPGATSLTYVIQSTDENHTLAIKVTGTNSTGSTLAESVATISVPVPVSPPVNSVLPVVSGTVAVGQTLSSSTGTWSGSPTYAYQWVWFDTGANISGATSSSYVLQVTDENHKIAVKVTATNSAGSVTSESVATVVVPVPITIPVNSVLPVVSGTVAVGNTLTATTGTWSQSPAFSYQWVWGDTGASISGATSLTYVIQATDEGHTLEIKVTGTNSAGAATAVSVATIVVPVPSSLPPNGTIFNRAGLVQTFQSNFTGPTPLVSDGFTLGAGMQWIDHTPWNGDFGYSPSNISNVSITKDPLLNGESVLKLAVNGTNGGPWTGAILSSTDSTGKGFSQAGGVFECRMKGPSGQGLWWSFWLDGSVSPQPIAGVSAEIDVIEIYTEWVNGYWATIHRWLAGVDTNTNNAFQIQPPVSPCDGNYHTYTVEITPTYGVLIYMDDVQVAAFQGDASVSGPMTMLLDLVVGGAGLAASACDGFSLPSNMLVSWVRAWKRP